MRVGVTRRHLLQWVTAAQICRCDPATRPRSAATGAWPSGPADRHRLLYALAAFARADCLWSGSFNCRSRCSGLRLACQSLAARQPVLPDPRTVRLDALAIVTSSTLAQNGAPHLAVSSKPSSPQPTTCCRRIISRKTRRRCSPIAPRRPISGSICSQRGQRTCDLGWIGIAHTARSAGGHARHHGRGCRAFRGHFFNWYDTDRFAPAGASPTSPPSIAEILQVI